MILSKYQDGRTNGEEYVITGRARTAYLKTEADTTLSFFILTTSSIIFHDGTTNFVLFREKEAGLAGLDQLVRRPTNGGF